MEELLRIGLEFLKCRIHFEYQIKGQNYGINYTEYDCVLAYAGNAHVESEKLKRALSQVENF